MLKAGSLYMVLGLSVILSVITGGILVIALHDQLIFKNALNLERVNRNASSAILLALTESSKIQPDKITQRIDLYGNSKDSVEIKKSKWGLLDIVTAKAWVGNHVSIKQAQYGHLLGEDCKYALYIADQDKPISVCGKSAVKGTAFLPRAGIKMAFIEGQSFSDDKFVNGEQKESEKGIPELRPDLLTNIQSILELKNLPCDSSMTVEDFLQRDSLVIPFFRNGVFVNSPSALEISNKVVKGKVIIASSNQITVKSNSVLEDVILIAPVIVFEEDTKCITQAFASDSLVLEDNVILEYPSNLVLSRRKDANKPTHLIIGEKVIIKGCVLNISDGQGLNNSSVLSIGKETKIWGQVVSNDWLDLKGSVYGSVTTKKLILTTPSSVYENHLLNAVANQELLPKQFIAPLLFNGEEKRSVLKWMY